MTRVFTPKLMRGAYSFCAALFIMSFAPASFAMTVEEAAQEAMSVTSPNFSTMVTDKNRLETLPADAFGDTQALEKLKGEDGMGDLFTPGDKEATACLSRNDPKCLAVQLVKHGAANKPELTEKEKEAIIKDYGSVIENAESLTEGATDLITSEKTCETVTTVIPGREEIELCDIGVRLKEGVCHMGWEMDKHTDILYRCDKTEAAKTLACTVTRKPLTHTETTASCTPSNEREEERQCTLTNHATVKATYPYRCVIEAPVATTQTCVKTLSVAVERACRSKLETTGDMAVFKEVGYSAANRFMKLKIGQPCRDTFAPITISFGTKKIATITEVPQTVTGTYLLTFHFTLERIGLRYRLTVTNVDAGNGTRTLTEIFPVIRNTEQTLDEWQEVCR